MVINMGLESMIKEAIQSCNVKLKAREEGRPGKSKLKILRGNYCDL
jgi:hypothetical protein